MNAKGPRPERLLTHRMARWVDDRLGAAKVARSALNKVFPDHWSFMIGELGLYCFIVLVLTGVYLTFFFDPSTRETIYSGSYEPLRGDNVLVLAEDAPPYFDPWGGVRLESR